MQWIKDAMIVSFLKQILKLFWDNWELVVLSHLLEKFTLFLANEQRGRLFFIFNWLWKAVFLCQPISEYCNRTTTLIPFLRAIKHFCNFIPSYFMEGFAFLIDDTSYNYYSSKSKDILCSLSFCFFWDSTSSDNLPCMFAGG